MTAAHRSIDGTSLHPGFIDECIECAPKHESGKHSPDDHHPYVDVSMSGVVSGFCYCGSRDETAALHSAPSCPDCLVEPDFGAPQPLWARIYSRLVARFGRQY